jgi:hypothetical protein
MSSTLTENQNLFCEFCLCSYRLITVLPAALSVALTNKSVVTTDFAGCLKKFKVVTTDLSVKATDKFVWGSVFGRLELKP